MNITRKNLPLAICALLNALVIPAALLALLVPGNAIFGWIFFALLWAGTFEYVRSLLFSKGSESIPVLLAGFGLFMLLPFLHMFLSALPLVPGHILLVLRALVLLPSLIMRRSLLRLLPSRPSLIVRLRPRPRPLAARMGKIGKPIFLHSFHWCWASWYLWHSSSSFAAPSPPRRAACSAS